jgi:RecA/RadA recombinase
MLEKQREKRIIDMSKFLSQLRKDAAKVYAPEREDWLATTKSPAVNYLFGKLGGVPAGNTMLLYGPPKSGKSLLSFAYAGQLHQQDPEAIILHFDTEMRDGVNHWEKAFGIDKERFISTKTNDPTKIFDYIANDVKAMLQDGAPIKMIIVDSLAGIFYPKEANKESSDKHVMGDAAAYLPGALKMILDLQRRYKIFTILTQQIRSNMDPNTSKYRPYIITGGNALRHGAEVWALVTKVEAKDSKTFDESKKDGAGHALQTQHTIRIKIEESSISPQNRAVEVDLSYTDGFVNEHAEIAKLAVNMGAVVLAGAWVQYNGKKWQGIANFANAIKEDSELRIEMLRLIKESDTI